ncbi:MAG: hypothetical protein HY940_09080 [Gammaproteobacteria bacterium]|nr:hypothetical protein [Gammaproteobacteria bacterium]
MAIRHSNHVKLSIIFNLLGVMASPALAVQAVAFDGWNVQGGNINTAASCGGTVSCSGTMVDNGFLQQEIVTPNGKFIRQIITDTNATGSASSLPFATEVLIPMGSQSSFQTGSNVDIKQAIRDPSQGFSSLAQINNHALIDNRGDSYQVNKVLIEQGIADATFGSAFKLEQQLATLPNGDQLSSRRLDIDQWLLDVANDPSSEAQRFAMRQRSGWDVIFDEQNNANITPVTKAGSVAMNGETLSWADGEALRAVFIAQKAYDPSGKGFAYTALSNETSGRALTKADYQAAMPTDPFAWDTANLGAAPHLPSVVN